MKIRLLAITFLSLTILSCKRAVDSYENYLIMVSFDGFRWDYPDLYEVPEFEAMAARGVKAERIIPSFPTKTFPNHYSMATGLYPDNHGLVDNVFYAPDLEMLYRIGDRSMVENPAFYGGEPIWNTAEKQGMISASFFWVGSEAPVQGMQPTYWKKYDGAVPFEARVDTVIHWLKLPLEKRPRLILLYFQEPDIVGHDFGPVHEETGKMVAELDQVLAKLRKEIKSLPYGKKVNLIVTSDHGMCATSPERYVNIMEVVAESWIENITGSSPVYMIDAVEGFEDSVQLKLNQAHGVTAWKKADVPEALNYGTHQRIADIVVVADSSWSIGLKSDPSGYSGGAHGYDNRNSDMHAIFYAEGPAFKKRHTHPAIENVDLYPLIANVLGLNPAPVDGDLEDVEGMLRVR